MKKLTTVVSLSLMALVLTACPPVAEPPTVDESTNPLTPQPATTDDANTVTAAEGTMTLQFGSDEIVVSGSYEGLTSAPAIVAGDAAAHVHYRGNIYDVPVVGDVVAGSFEASIAFDDIAQDFDDADAATVRDHLRSGHWAYFNIHTDLNPAGELYGWLSDESDAYAGTVLIPQPATSDSANTVTTATGSFDVEFRDDDFTVSGSFADLTSEPVVVAGDSEAHLHYRGAIFDVPVDGDAASGSFNVTATYQEFAEVFGVDAATAEANLRAGNWVYFNVHTDVNPGGELYFFVSE